MTTAKRPGKVLEGATDAQPMKRAWVAASAIDAQGRRCIDPEKRALTIVAVSVNEGLTPTLDARVELMQDVGRVERIPQGTVSLWVYPAGYIGFDAASYLSGNEAAAWPGVDPGAVEAMLPEIVQAHPAGAWIVFGVDSSSESQEAWLVRNGGAGSGVAPVLHKVRRNESEPAARCFALDDRDMKAAFFVCSEIVGYENQFLDCRVIVDLAHVRVPGTVWSDKESSRMAHQRALTPASKHGAAVLAHHHGDHRTAAGHEHFRHQSNWILFQGNGTDWLDSAEVEVVR